jgi:hypothetical protein
LSNKCNITFRISPNAFRFFKIKSFDGSANLKFNLNSDAILGLPDTTIHSIGQIGTSTKDKKELYITFPNQLKSISDVLDYSIYQATF